MNKVIMTGNLTKDPELTETSNGIAVCHFSIAVNRPYTDANGERQTDFFNVVTWRGQAENCGRYLSKGKKVAVVGNLQNRSYETQNGEKRFITEIIAQEVEFLSPLANTANNEERAPVKKEQTTTQQSFIKEKPTLEEIDDDLPF